jgi:hypothetical protein
LTIGLSDGAMTSFFASPYSLRGVLRTIGKNRAFDGRRHGCTSSTIVHCKHCGLLTDRGVSHERADLCIRALQREIATLRQALEMLTLGAGDSPPPNGDTPPSTSRQKGTPK